MTTIFNDNVQIDLTVDGNTWYLKDAKVELSRMDTPNYVDLLMVPDPDETVPGLPSPIDALIGSDFRLEADNTLITERDSNAEEDNLLFDGNLANISATGRNSYEAIAYDPGQQAFAGVASAENAEQQEKSGGSIMNDLIYLGQPEYSYPVMYGPDAGTTYEAQTIQASDLIQRAVERINLTEYDIELAEGGIEVEGEEGSKTMAYDRTLWFSDTFITVKEAFTKAREWCEAEWWFDKEGVFHFGPPRPTRHELQFITDSDAGKTTPPYQSVRVIGSGSASAESYSRTNMEIEDKIVVEAEIARSEESGEIIPNFGNAAQPTFEYHNLEVSTDAQARSTATKLIEDLAEQQADGKITVVGFPEIVPMDGVIMPQNKDPEANNFQPEQPMGGMGYGVYKVVHHLNNSDGFITEIHVSAITGVTATVVSESQAETSYDETDVNIPPGLQAQGSSGARPVR